MACHFCWVSIKKLAVDDTKSYPHFTFRHSLKAAADFSPSPGLSALGNSFKVLLIYEQVDWCLSSLFPPLPSQATSQPVLPPSLLLSLRSYWCYHNWLGHHCEGKLQQKKQHPVPQSSTLSSVLNAILSLHLASLIVQIKLLQCRLQDKESDQTFPMDDAGLILEQKERGAMEKLIQSPVLL